MAVCDISREVVHGADAWELKRRVWVTLMTRKDDVTSATRDVRREASFPDVDAETEQTPSNTAAAMRTLYNVFAEHVARRRAILHAITTECVLLLRTL